MTDPTVRIGSKKLCLLQQGDQYCAANFLYLKRSSIGLEKFQRVHPEPFLTTFQFCEEL